MSKETPPEWSWLIWRNSTRKNLQWRRMNLRNPLPNIPTTSQLLSLCCMRLMLLLTIGKVRTKNIIFNSDHFLSGWLQRLLPQRDRIWPLWSSFSKRSSTRSASQETPPYYKSLWSLHFTHALAWSVGPATWTTIGRRTEPSSWPCSGGWSPSPSV